MGTAAAGPTGAEIARMAEHTEAAAYADLLRAAPVEWRCVAEETDAGWMLLAPTLDVLLFNRIVGCGLDRPARRADLHRLIGRYRDAGLRNFGVQLVPSALPSDVGRWLGEAGLLARDRWAKVFRPDGAVAPAPTELRVERIGSQHAAALASVTTAGFGMPDSLRPWIASCVGRRRWLHYLAWRGAEPVAAAALFIRGEVGWLGIASTLPAARRQGAQGALMARRLEDGAALGCRWFVTETSEETPDRPNPSFHNMMRAGFAVAYHRANFLPATS